MSAVEAEIVQPDRLKELDELIQQIEDAIDDPDSVSDSPNQFLIVLRKMVNDAVDVAQQLTTEDYDQFYVDEGEGGEDGETETDGAGANEDYFS